MKNLSCFLLFSLVTLTTSINCFGQDAGFKRWRYEKDGKEVVFTAKFKGLSEENAVFSNRENKLAEIPLEKLSRESLEDLVVMFVPPANAPGDVAGADNAPKAEEANNAGNDSPWKKKLTRDFTKTVGEVEKIYKTHFKGIEKWTETKRDQKEAEFLSKLASHRQSFTIPCTVQSISSLNSGLGFGIGRDFYSVTLRGEGIRDMTIPLHKRAIGSLDVDKGTKVELECTLGISNIGPSKLQGGFATQGVPYSVFKNNVTKDYSDIKLPDAIDTGVKKNGRTYYPSILSCRIDEEK